LYCSIFGGNVIEKGSRVGRLVTGTGVGTGDGDVGDVVTSTGIEVGVLDPLTPMSVGSKASEGTKVLDTRVGNLVAKVSAVVFCVGVIVTSICLAGTVVAGRAVSREKD
jgi:hypothetical protein